MIEPGTISHPTGTHSGNNPRSNPSKLPQNRQRRHKRARVVHVQRNRTSLQY